MKKSLIIITICLLSSLTFSQNKNITIDKKNPLPEKYVKKLCYKTKFARKRAENSYLAFKKELESTLKELNIEYENVELFLSDNLSLIKCECKDAIKMRKYNSVFKWAIDSRDYDFVMNAIFVKKDGKNICNPNIDFSQSEMINGKNETIVDFIDKLLNDSRMQGFHDFETIENLKMRIEGCL